MNHAPGIGDQNDCSKNKQTGFVQFGAPDLCQGQLVCLVFKFFCFSLQLCTFSGPLKMLHEVF